LSKEALFKQREKQLVEFYRTHEPSKMKIAARLLGHYVWEDIMR
jgi:hypothetical protein